MDDHGYFSFSGCEDGEFNSIPSELKPKLVRAIARIMERAYRRGVQQAITLFKGDAISPDIPTNLYDWRYGKSLDESGGIDGYTTTSLERLKMEECIEKYGLDWK